MKFQINDTFDQKSNLKSVLFLSYLIENYVLQLTNAKCQLCSCRKLFELNMVVVNLEHPFLEFDFTVKKIHYN